MLDELTDHNTMLSNEFEALIYHIKNNELFIQIICNIFSILIIISGKMRTIKKVKLQSKIKS